MTKIHDLIAGVREAEEKARAEQLEAFLDMEPSIAGQIVLKPFTPRMYLELSAAGNGFFSDSKSVSAEDVLQFLWRCSEDFDRVDTVKRSAFWQACALLNAQQVIAELEEYIRRAWRVMPQWGTGGNSSSIGTWASYLVHLLSHSYGWSEGYILDLPFRRLFQYAHRILEQRDPEYRQKSPEAMALRAEWLKAQNSRN